MQEELGLVEKAPDPRPPPSVEVRWAAAAALSLVVIAMAAVSVVRDRPARSTLWGGPPSSVAGVAEGTLRVARCEGGTALVGVDHRGSVQCARIVLHRSPDGVVAGVEDNTGFVQCRGGEAIVALGGTILRGEQLVELHGMCATPAPTGDAWVEAGDARSAYTVRLDPGWRATDLRRFELRCGPQGFVRAVHFYGPAGVLRGLRVECATLTAPR